MSLQKAYSLLCSSPTAIIQYKVYASLSRLGYRVFRHTGPKVNEEKKSCSQKDNHGSNANPHTIPMDENYDTPTADMNKSECIDSHTSTVLLVDSPTVTVKSENDSSVVSTLFNSDNIDSPIDSAVKESEDSSIVNTVFEPEKGESGAPMDNTISDSKSDSTLIVETVPDSNIVYTPKDATFEKTDDSQMSNKVCENEQEQTIEQEDGRCSEVNGNIVETYDVKENEVMAEKLEARISIAKENESPNVMEVDDTAELKTADIKDVMEANQEVPSTMIDINKNAEITTESMEICTKDQEAGMGHVIFTEINTKKKD